MVPNVHAFQGPHPLVPHSHTDSGLSHVFWAELCPPENSYVEVLTPAPVLQNVIVFGDRTFKQVSSNEVIRVALIQCDWYPYKKRKLGPRHALREDHVKTQGEDGHLQAKERGLGKKQLCQHLDLGLLASRIVRK